MSREDKKGNVGTSRDGSGWATQPGEGFSDGAGDIHGTFHVDASSRSQIQCRLDLVKAV